MPEHLLDIPVYEPPPADRSTLPVRVYGEWEPYTPEHPDYVPMYDLHGRLRGLHPVTRWHRPVYETWHDAAGDQWGRRVGWENSPVRL